MKIDKILIILGEPNSTFSEILFKYFNSKEFLKNKKKNNFNWKSIFTSKAFKNFKNKI